MRTQDLNVLKKIFILIICLSLVLGISFTACAESAKRNEEDYAIRKVNATSLMIGTDKGFEGEKELTRAEAITIMMRMKGISEETIKEFRTKDGEDPVFSDVPSGHWANPYVNAALNLNLTEGVGEGLFNPSFPVTVMEIYTMAIRTINAGKLVDSERKDYKDEEWYIPYLNFANDHHMSDNVNGLFTEVSNRSTCAVIISNTLNQFLWESSKVTSGNSHKELPEVTWTESRVKLIDHLGFKEVQGVTITEVDTKDKKIKTLERLDSKSTFDSVSSLDLSSIKRGIKYTLWFDERSGSINKDKLTGFFEEVNSSDVIYFKDIKKIGTNYITVIEKDNSDDNSKSDSDKELKLNTVMNRDDLSKFGFDLYINDVKKTDYTALSEESSLSGYLIKDSDGKISKMYIEEFTFFGVIKEITDKKITFETSKTKVKGSITETISLSEDNEVIFADLKVGDGVMFHKERRSDLYSGSSSGWRYTVEKLESHSGRIKSVSTETRTTRGVKVQSVTLLGDYENGIWKLDARINDYKVNAGDEGVFFLNENKQIVLFAPYSESTGDYIFVNSTRKLRPKYVGDDPTYELKVQTMDGNQTDWLELDFDESAANIAGLKAWTLTNIVCNDELALTIHLDDDIESGDTATLDDEYFAAHRSEQVYIIDKWIFDGDLPGASELPDYTTWNFWEYSDNYLIFAKKDDAKKAAIKIIKELAESRENNDGIYSLFNGHPFTAKISGSKITLTGLGKNYTSEWMYQNIEEEYLPECEISLIMNYVNTKKYDYLTNHHNDKYYLSDDAKVFASSWNGKFGYEQEIKLKKLDKENIESITELEPTGLSVSDYIGISSLFAYALGIDEEERETSFVILPEKLTRQKTDTELWALVISSGETVNDKDVTLSDNENIDSFVDVIFEGTNKVRTLYFDSSNFDGFNDDFATLKGLDSPRIFKLDIEGSEIKKARGNTQNVDSVCYFTDNSDGKPGLLTYKEGILTKIVNDTRIRLSSSYISASVGSAASFTELDEDYFLSDKVLLLEKEEGTDNYKIVDHIENFNETELDLESVPDTEEKKLKLNTKNLEDYIDNALTFITYDKEGNVTILAIIKG